MISLLKFRVMTNICNPKKRNANKVKVHTYKCVAAFCALMAAIHHHSLNEFEYTALLGIYGLTELADYYCALPMVSLALYPVLISTEDEQKIGEFLMDKWLFQTLEVAMKLRREKTIIDLLEKLYGKICEKVTNVREEILQKSYFVTYEEAVRFNQVVKRHRESCWVECEIELHENDTNRFSLPFYYRKLHEGSDEDVNWDIKDSIGQLLRSKLSLFANEARAGKAGY
ncbi:hypothetical protein B0J14DRAFT_570495 [Halenospora varia]|nr:hypothetical protein B0J14DRAFT_570495 [Halenospora varia]